MTESERGRERTGEAETETETGSHRVRGLETDINKNTER